MHTSTKIRALSMTLLVTLVTSGVGCATVRPSQYRPMIDTKGVDMTQYERDVGECQAFARQIDQERSAANGAVAGAVFGLILGAAFGLRNSNLAQVTAAGAVAGGARSAEYAGMTQIQIIGGCMVGRGYSVLAQARGRAATT